MIDWNIYSISPKTSKPHKSSHNAHVLELLSQTIRDDANSAVRGEALVAIASLTDHPEQAFAVSLQAIRSGEAEYQLYAMRALETVINRQTTQNGLELSVQNTLDVHTLVDELMNPDFDELPIQVRQAIDELYQRYFRASL